MVAWYEAERNAMIPKTVCFKKPPVNSHKRSKQASGEK